MKTIANMPLQQVAAVLIRREAQFLLAYNDAWGAFALPMSRRRELQDPAMPGSVRVETWEEAAVRATAKRIGRTLLTRPKAVIDSIEYQQSDRDGIWKRYTFRIFEIELELSFEPRGAGVTEWLLMEDICDNTRTPISETARSIVRQFVEAKS